MNKFVDLIKSIVFFPLYIRKIHAIVLELRAKTLSLEKELENNLTYSNTVISSYLSQNSGVNLAERAHEITISLTSYSYRVDKVHLTIQSLMDQELKADRITLNLDQSKFDHSNLPYELRMLEARGLTITYCKDTGPYTKLLPTLRQYPGNLIVTVDDDLIYPRSLLRELYEAYLKEPHLIHCHRMHRMRFDTKGQILPYKDWELESSSTAPGLLVFPTGVGGVLYPPNSLHDEVFNEQAYMTLAPMADDVWFKAMSLMNGVKCKKVDSKYKNRLIEVRDTQEIALYHKNYSADKNDRKIADVFSAYKLWNILERDA